MIRVLLASWAEDFSDNILLGGVVGSGSKFELIEEP